MCRLFQCPDVDASPTAGDIASRGHAPLRRLLLACAILIAIQAAASAQISRRQSGPGNVTRRDVVVRPGVYSKDLHRWVISTEIDARATLKQFPRESQACIAACERLEAALLGLDNKISDSTVDEYEAAWRQMQFAHRDWQRRVTDKTKKYQPPYIPRRSQVKSRMGTQ